MPRNVEIKASLESLDAIRPAVEQLATSGPTEIYQDDTFFFCRQGRLKLRQFSETAGELIFYRRADEEGPRESFYVITQTAEPAALREVLALAYGQTGRVLKNRTLFMIGRTRVHLDRVQDLGDFLELEVVLADDEPVNAGEEIARRLLLQLDISPTQLIKRAYFDLLTAAQRPFS